MINISREGSLRALHVIAGLSESDGGPAYTVPRLCQALADQGASVDLMAVAGKGNAASDAVVNGYRDRRFPWSHSSVPVLGALRYSSELSHAIDEEAPSINVIHGHGLWLMPNVLIGHAAVVARKRLIIAPRGMLGEAALAFSRKKKYLFWYLLQRSAVRQAVCLHATSEQEYEEIRAFGLKNPVAIIRNGIDLPPEMAGGISDKPAEHILLSLGRLHPKKGLDRLLQAWAKVEPGYPEWRLRIVGPSELGHGLELQAMAASLNLQGVSIEPPVYGKDRSLAYRDADLFVLPTRNENFAMTVAEALAAGVPVISTKGAPWPGLETHGCGWWIDHGVDSLVSALNEALAMPRKSLAAMGANGRLWMAQEFSWDRVASDTLDVYRWCVHGEPPPPSVRFG